MIAENRSVMGFNLIWLWEQADRLPRAYDQLAFMMAKPPFIIEGLALLCGYCWAAIRRTKRPVSKELMRFHRHEQMKKLRTICRSLLSFRKVDNFRTAGEVQDLN